MKKKIVGYINLYTTAFSVNLSHLAGGLCKTKQEAELCRDRGRKYFLGEVLIEDKNNEIIRVE